MTSFSYSFYRKIKVGNFFLKLSTIYSNQNSYGSFLKDYDKQLIKNKLQNIVKKENKL